MMASQVMMTSSQAVLKWPLLYLLSVLPSGLCPDWETWDPSQPVENAREAMQQADDWLGVPQVHTALRSHDPR